LATAVPLSVEALVKSLEGATGYRHLPATPQREKLTDDGLLEPKLCALAHALAKESEQTTWEHRKKRALNMSFFRDQQQARWNAGLREMETEPKFPRGHFDPRIYLNFFKAIAMTAVARFEGTRPRAEVLPGSTDQVRVSAAQACEKVVTKHEWRAVEMDQRIAEAIWHMYLLDTAVWEVAWDPMLGPIVDVQEEETKDENGNASVNLVPIHQGANKVTTYHPNDVMFDPTVVDFYESSWCGTCMDVSPTMIANTWGVVLQPEASQSVYRTVRSRNFLTPKTVKLYRIWVKPGRYPFGSEEGMYQDFPTGYTFTVAGNRLLEHGPNPYEHGRFPFVFMPCLPIPEEAWGDTIMNSLRVCQVALNKLMHQSLDIITKLGVPRIIQSRNAPLQEKDRHNLPGVWEHNPTGRPFDEPRPWPALQPPPGMYQLIEMVIRMMQQIAGWREGGMAGGAITGDTSGVAYQTLTGNDMARLESTARQLERGIERCLWLLMRNIKQFWTQERAVTVAGDGMETETVRFMGTMVSDEFEIRVVPQSSIPATKQATFQRALTLFQAGAFGDPMTPAARRELMKRIGEE
jgi:hypothetical protein